jgi:PBSX family phage portal protein|tara:strand:+ start:2717 stop:4330 length:1614 start_codon:yes stop_codon:yes gene_type:complete
MSPMSHFEEEISIPEIEDISYVGFDVVSKAEDGFKKVKLANQSTKMKRRGGRLNKKAREKDGTKSKYVDPEVIDGYALFDVVTPPYELTTLAELYEQSSIHYASVNARTMNTVALGYRFDDSKKAQRKLEKSQAVESKLSRVRDDIDRAKRKMDGIFDDINENETFIETLIKVWNDYLTVGNGYLEIGRNNSGKIGYVGHVPATLVRVRRDRDGFVQLANNAKINAVFFRNFQDLETKDPINSDPTPNELIHFKSYTPNNTYYGVPPAVPAAAAIVGDKFAKEYNIDYFENKAIPRYAIVLKGAKLSQKSKQELVNYFRQEVKGKHHGTLIVPLPPSMGQDSDIRFEKLEAGVQDSSFDKYRKSNRDEILVGNRVPAPKVGVYDNANLAVSRDADKTFKTQVVGPDQAIIEKRINRIVQEFTTLVTFKFETIDLIDEDIQSRINDRYLRTEVVSPNEIRQAIGLPQRLGGNDFLPYPSKIKQAQLEADQEEQGAGAPEGNDNAESGTPPKAEADRQDGGTPTSDTGDRRERGENQDE